MPTYQRKQKAIEATRFTSDHGGIVRGVTPGDAPAGLAYSEHAGYTFHGVRIAFGDYMAGVSVVARDDFEREYEPAVVYDETAEHVREGRRLIDAAVEATGSTGSAAVDTVLAAKAKARGKRTQESE